MKTSFTVEEHKFIGIFDNYINGNLSDFRKSIKRLSKINLLKCIDLVIVNYGQTYGEKEVLRIFLYHL